MIVFWPTRGRWKQAITLMLIYLWYYYHLKRVRNGRKYYTKKKTVSIHSPAAIMYSVQFLMNTANQSIAWGLQSGKERRFKRLWPFEHGCWQRNVPKRKSVRCAAVVRWKMPCWHQRPGVRMLTDWKPTGSQVSTGYRGGRQGKTSNRTHCMVHRRCP